MFDTKSGITIKNGKEKSDGLQSYLAQSVKSKKMIGGIVANTDSNNFNGRWMIYHGAGKDLIYNNFSNWELLEI